MAEESGRLEDAAGRRPRAPGGPVGLDVEGRAAAGDLEGLIQGR